MSAACMKDIFRWVEQSLQGQPVPETGGFLTGKFLHDKQADSFVSWVEHFVPAEGVDYQDPVLLAFGTGPLLEVDRYLQAQPGQCLIGWFHTHPGHSPYLSATDLHTHEGFFREAYQVAIVLDPLTPAFDTGIFSRKTDGSMNNQIDYSHWFQWKHTDIYRQMEAN